MERTHKLLLLQFHLLIILVPLFFSSVNDELFEFNKMLLVYAFAATIATTWITKMIIARKVIWKRTPLDIPILLFFLSQVVSTVLSIHPRTSLIGYYSRFNGGLLSLISYLVLFYAAAGNMTQKNVKAILKTLLLSGVIVSLYAFPEHFGASPSCFLISHRITVDCWVQDVQSRVFGTFGQPNWLAAFLIMLIPLAMAFLTSELHKKTRSVRSILGYGGATLLFSSVLLFTRSRSGILALAVGLTCFFVLFLIQRLRNKDTRMYVKRASLPLVLLILPAVVFGTPFTASLSSLFRPITQPVEEVSHITPGGSQLESGGTESGVIRKIVWKGAVDVWRRYPFFGSGVETFAYSYYTDRPLAHNLISEWDFLYNKAHNEFLNYLATTGAVGLITYLFMMVAVAVLCIRASVSRKSSETEKLTIAALFSGYIGLSASNVFGFSTVMTSVLFYLFPALVYILGEKDSDHTQPSRTPSTATYLFVALAWLLALFILWEVAAFWVADKTYAYAKRLESSYPVEAFRELQRATQLLPDEPNYRDELSLVSAKLSVLLAEQNEATAAAQLAEQAVTESDIALSQNPVHLNLYKTRARVFILLAQLNSAALDEAVRTLERAQDLAPTDPKLPYNVGVIRKSQGNIDDAEYAFLDAITLKPNYEEARNALATLYEGKKEYGKAIEQLQYIVDNINPDNDVARQKIEDLSALSR